MFQCGCLFRTHDQPQLQLSMMLFLLQPLATSRSVTCDFDFIGSFVLLSVHRFFFFFVTKSTHFWLPHIPQTNGLPQQQCSEMGRPSVQYQLRNYKQFKLFRIQINEPIPISHYPQGSHQFIASVPLKIIFPFFELAGSCLLAYILW